MTPDNRPLYEALIRIRNLTELAPFKAHLDAQIAYETKMMIGQADEKSMWRAQGALRILTELKNLIENSNTVLDKPRPAKLAGYSVTAAHS